MLIVVLALQLKRPAQSPWYVEGSDIAKIEKEQHLDFHLMVIQRLNMNASLMTRNLLTVSYVLKINNYYSYALFSDVYKLIWKKR